MILGGGTSDIAVLLLRHCMANVLRMAATGWIAVTWNYAAPTHHQYDQVIAGRNKLRSNHKFLPVGIGDEHKATCLRSRYCDGDAACSIFIPTQIAEEAILKRWCRSQALFVTCDWVFTLVKLRHDIITTVNSALTGGGALLRLDQLISENLKVVKAEHPLNNVAQGLDFHLEIYAENHEEQETIDATWLLLKASAYQRAFWVLVSPGHCLKHSTRSNYTL